MQELNKNKLEILSQDKLMLQAIWEVFNEGIEKHKPNIGLTDNNTILGEKFRAYEIAKNILGDVMTNLESYQNNQINHKPLNKAK